MKKEISVSVIIPTYNWPEALNLCLQSVLAQSILPDEIIIADDGSKQDTCDLINNIKQKSAVPIIHVWQEDDGFRLAQIRNKAIARSSKDYIIQIDGDVILHKDFIKDHIRFARKGSFVSGSRVIIEKELAEQLLSSQTFKISIYTKGTQPLLITWLRWNRPSRKICPPLKLMCGSALPGLTRSITPNLSMSS